MLIPFDELFARFQIKPNGVLHLGANTGQEADAYQNLGIKKVIWVEADPDVHQKLLGHVGSIPGHRVFNVCVGDEDGKEVVFHVANNKGQSSSVLELGTHKTAHPEVHFVKDLKMKTARVSTMLHKAGIVLGRGWFLNADLQGAELMALRGMVEILYCFDHLYLEVNERPLYVNCPLVADIDAFLEPLGFLRVCTRMSGNHGWGDALYSR